MPRVTIKKKDYMLSDFTAWIVGTLSKEKKKKKELAEAMGISQQLLSHKLKSNQYNLLDIINIFDFLKAEDEEVVKLLRMER